MTKYQEAVQIKRAVQKQLKKQQGKKTEYIYRGVCYDKTNSELPNYITDNPYYP